jgi:hypothetical protein
MFFLAKGVSMKNLLLLSMLISGFANAGVIVSPVSGVIDSGGPGFGTLTETFNQAGLSAGFISGVTDFATYIASSPTHTLIYSGNEWFSNLPSTTATVTYDLGSVLNISQLALWNEESSGIGVLNLLGSSDGLAFSSLGTFSPTNNPTGSDYLADVFSFSPTNAKYVRFEMSGCPQAGSTFDSCSIGEVAFNVTAVPEPETYAMMFAGLGLMGFVARRRKEDQV